MSFATKYAMQKRASKSCPECQGAGCKMCHGGYTKMAFGGDAREVIRNYDEEKNTKGINKQEFLSGGYPGISKAGYEVQRANNSKRQADLYAKGAANAKSLGLEDKHINKFQKDQFEAKNNYGEQIEKAKDIHRQTLDEMRSMKSPSLYAEGGEVDDDDLVSHIMRKRHGKDEPTADFEDADFDADFDAGMEADYTGENSGDELGEPHEDMDDEDVVSHIMRKRRERNPRPA